FGRFAHSAVAVANAARAGAGLGAGNPPSSATLSTWKAQVTQAVKDEMADVGTPTTVTVSDPYTQDGLLLFKVTVEYPLTTIFTWPGVPQKTTTHREIVMRFLK